MENKKEAVETPKSATLTGAEEADTLARNTNIRARCWCATLNNYTKEEYEDILLKLNETEISIVGKEKGESGTPHLQMCMKYKNARTFASMKKLNERMHIEVCKNWPASMLYCKKENDYVVIILFRHFTGLYLFVYFNIVIFFFTVYHNGWRCFTYVYIHFFI